jgi:CrcB protein
MIDRRLRNEKNQNIFHHETRYSMSQVLAIAAGGAIGSLLRFWLSTWVHTFADRSFPYGTLAVNVLGCLLMGFLFVLFIDRLSDNPVLRAGILIGVLGGFTTFSTFSIETFNLIEQGAWVRAAANMSGSLVLCVGATWIGVLLGRQV